MELALYLALAAAGTGLAFAAIYFALSQVGELLGLLLPAPSFPVDSVQSFARVRRYVDGRLANAEPRYVVGGIEIPASHLAPHTVTSGTTGSGKSMLQLMHEKSAIAPNGELIAHAIHLDPKLGGVSELVGMGVPLSRQRILCPTDARSRPVDLSIDFETPVQARELATILVPSEKNSTQPFFVTAVQDLFTEAVVAFQKTTPRAWTLADVLGVLRTPDAIREHLGQTSGGRDALAAYIDGEAKLQAHVMATLRSKTSSLATVAALWESSPNEPISLSEWVDSDEPSVLVFGHDSVHDSITGPILRALFLRLSQLLLGRPVAKVKHPVWVYADEVRLFGRLEGLAPLMFAGRAYQVHVNLAFQDFEGLASVWGEKEAGELIGQCGNVATLRLENPATMELASRFYGDEIVWVEGTSESTDRHGFTSTSKSWSQQVRRRFMPAYFRDLPPPTPATGIAGVFTTPALPVWTGPIPPDVVSRLLPQPDPNTPGFVPRPPDDQTMPPPTPPPPTTNPPDKWFRTMDGDHLRETGS